MSKKKKIFLITGISLLVLIAIVGELMLGMYGLLVIVILQK